MTDRTQPEALRALAEAATWTGKWYDAGCNTVYCTYDKEDSILHDEIAHPVPFGVSGYIAAAHPQAVIALLDRIAELESELEAVGAGGVQALSAAPEAIAKLRHLYQNMVNGAVRDTASAKRIAEGLLAPAIEALERAAPKAAPSDPDDHQILAITTAYEQGVGKGRQAHSSGKEIANPYGPGYRCDLAWQYGYKEGKEQAERIAKAAPQQEPVWDGKLSDAMQNALDALYIECGPGITRDITHQVQKECEAIYTSYTTTKRMYQAARDRLELLEAAQPQPDPFAAPQPAPAPLSEQDPLQGAANWLAQAHGQFCVSVLQGCLMIGHNRAKRLHDAALAAQGGTP